MNIKDMDYEQLTSYEEALDLLHDSLGYIKLHIGLVGLEDTQSIYTKLHMTSYADHIDSKRKEVQEQKKLIQDKADEAYDTLQDLDNSQK